MRVVPWKEQLFASSLFWEISTGTLHLSFGSSPMHLSGSGSLVQRIREPAGPQAPVGRGRASLLINKDAASNVRGLSVPGEQLLLHLEGHWPEFQL